MNIRLTQMSNDSEMCLNNEMFQMSYGCVVILLTILCIPAPLGYNENNIFLWKKMLADILINELVFLYWLFPGVTDCFIDARRSCA